MRESWNPEEQTWQEWKESRFAGYSGMGQPNSKTQMRGECKVTGIQKRKCDCRTCINRRNRQKGRTKQNAVRKKLKIPDRKFHGADAHEENWDSEVRVEVKSGKQVGPIYTRFQKAEAQSWENVKDSVGGAKSKPFMMVAMPDGTSDGIVLFRLSELENVVQGLIENWDKKENMKES